MATRTTIRRPILATCTALVLVATACGSDSGNDEATDSVAIADTDGAPIEALTAEQICERLTLESVGSALGLDIGLAEPSSMETPQCAYSYDTNGTTSNLTVASMRPEDVAGLTGAEAYDYVLEINRSIAGDDEVDEVTLDAGDAATRISGPALHLGVVHVGDRVITVIVPTGDASGPDVDSLISKIATALA